MPQSGIIKTDMRKKENILPTGEKNPLNTASGGKAFFVSSMSECNFLVNIQFFGQSHFLFSSNLNIRKTEET